MKTIVENSTGLSKYLFEDVKTININIDNIVIGDPAEFIISDMNSTTATIYENTTVPSDWAGNKYFFNGADWSLNPKWTEPKKVWNE